MTSVSQNRVDRRQVYEQGKKPGRAFIKDVFFLTTYLGDNRSLWVGACNSTIFLSRRFHRPILFSIESTLNETSVGGHNQSQETNWRHCVTGPELPLFHRRKGELKIDQSVKMPWHRLSMGVASSFSSDPGDNQDLKMPLHSFHWACLPSKRHLMQDWHFFKLAITFEPLKQTNDHKYKRSCHWTKEKG